MEMTLTVHLPRRRPRPLEVVVDWEGEHTAAELCDALATRLAEPVRGLSVRGLVVDPAAPVGLPPLVHGASVVAHPELHTGAVAKPAAAGVLELVVVGGPDAGRSHVLSPPGVTVGRGGGCDLSIEDGALSRVHAVLRVGPSGMTVADAGSTNGIEVDGARVVAGSTVVDVASTLLLGSSTLRLRRSPVPGTSVGRPGDGTLVVRPSAGPPAATASVDIECPAPPPDRQRTRVPWVGALAPVPVALALAVFLGPQLLLFALLGPFVLLATALGDRWGSGRTRRREAAAHERAVAAARARLGRALQDEAARLHRVHPDPNAVLRTAEQHLPGLWVGGPRADVRLGLGRVPTRVTWVEGSRRTTPPASRVPVVVDLAEVGALAVVGAAEDTDRHLAALVGQLCTAHPPDQLSVAVAGHEPSWEWVRRVPHAVTVSDLLAEGVGSTPEVGPTPGRGAQAVRSAAGRDARHRLLVVPTGAVARSVTARARDAGVLVLIAVPGVTGVPAGCGAVVARASNGDGHVLQRSTGDVPLTLDLVGAWWTDRVSRALAPLRLRGRGSRQEPPGEVTLAELLGVPEVTEDHVLERWGRGAAVGDAARPLPAACAVVGVGPHGAYSIDLARDGPHVLVGGTTGAGKSEFLRTLVTSLAVECRPQDLSFVLVDFKGGAAFGACAALPHVVGLVTDLDNHLVARALTSLGAELRRRERLFAGVGAQDLEGYRHATRDGGEPVPRLVVVVDELRALLDEVPEFVSGLVRLAALGRSLGVHLVLATQRPAGALTAEIQANVSLRIAFRVRDRADSVDILEHPSAAGISSSTPGRGMSRGGDGELVTFQGATVASRTPTSAHHLRVLLDGEEEHSVRRRDRRGDEGTAALAAVIRAAHRRAGGELPRSPWLAPLPTVLPWSTMSAPEAEGVEPAVEVGTVDEPDQQRMSALVWRPSQGTWLLSGRPRSGRTTALRALVLAAAARLPPDQLHVHVIDPSTALADLDELPHLGTRVGVGNRRSLAGLVARLQEEVDTRAGAPPPARGCRPTVLVVVDGWDQLVEAQPSVDPDGLAGRLVTLLRDGCSVGVVGAVSGGRGLLQPRWAVAGGPTFLLGAVDPLDAALTGLRTADLALSPPPGRAVRTQDRREAQFMLATAGDTAGVAAAAGSRPEVQGAWRLRALPILARRRENLHVTPASSVVHPVAAPPLPVGLSAPASAPWAWDPDLVGRRIVVAGPPGSGRTNTLAVIAQAALASGRVVAVVQARAAGGTTSPDFAGAQVIGSGDLDTLVELRRRHPDLVVLADDADRLDDAPVLAALREVVELADRDRGLVAVSTTSTALASRFRGLDVDVARHRSGILLNPAPHDGDLLGARGLDDLVAVPGRGVVVTRGRATELQVFLAEASAGGVVGSATAAGGGPRKDLRVGVAGDPGGEDRHDGDQDHRPAHRLPAALDEPVPDGQQQHVPHERGRPRPRAVAQPAAGEQRQRHGADEDEQGRHQHPHGVAALADHQLDHVEGDEPPEGEGLDAGQQRGEAAGAA